MPKQDLDCLRAMKGFETFGPNTEPLTMIKHIYGLEDAPRAWRTKFHQVCAGWMSCQQLYVELELYCVRGLKQEGGNTHAIIRAIADDAEQREVEGNSRTLFAQHYILGNFKCLLSAHVDDIKGIATRQTADFLLAHLKKAVGTCKADYGSFLHTGIQHEHSPGEVYTHQYVYIDIVAPIEVSLLIGGDEEALCTQSLHDVYRFV